MYYNYKYNFRKRFDTSEECYFDKEILNDLIKNGYTGEELKKEFLRIKKQIKPAIQQMIKDATKNANEFIKNYKDETDEIFKNDEI